jgi:diguanylate cyclase (GGDEF)-like protein
MSTLTAEQRRRGLSRLRFSRYVEEQFRQHYGALHQPQVRPLLVLAAVAVIAVTVFGLAEQSISAVTATFGLSVMMPLLTATLIASYQLERTDLYQPLLAASLLCIGLIVNSLTLRASLHGTPYFFGLTVAWLFVVWLSLGLLFSYAALASFSVSVTYIYGLLHWNFGPHQTLFESMMLVGVNAIGALSCYQIEVTTREAFRDHRILADLAERDGLTGLYNRRAYNDYMERIWRQSRREEGQLTIMMIDIDQFKAFNDMYGHQAGDDALKRVAAVIAMGAQRPLDLAARFGGEEFALVLYSTANDFSRELPEQIRARVEELAIAHAESLPTRCLTVSIGVAIVDSGAERSLAGAVQLADEALYQAKAEGGNRIVVKETRLTHIETGRFRASKKRAATG